jgi:putative NADH-flavin reductase
MKVVLYGATGMIGSRVLKELVARGHQVTAVARNVSQVPAEPSVTAVSGNILDAEDVARKVKGADAVINSYAPSYDAAGVGQLLDATHALIAGMKKAGVRRVIMAGGAGSLFVAPGVTVIDSGHLPPELMGIAVAHRDAKDILRESGLDWTNFSPPAIIEPGERTGKFRLGKDDLIVVDEAGASRISAEDYAIAMVDELETPKHIGQRFTIGY